MGEILTPHNVERRLIELSNELDEVSHDLTAAETVYYESKMRYELAIARKRLEIADELRGTKTTVQEREDMALIAVEDYAMELAANEAILRSSRANIARIKTQIDVARSLGTSVRASYEAL